MEKFGSTAHPASTGTSRPTHTDILGVRVSAVDLPDVVETIMQWMRTGRRSFITVTGVHGIVEAQGDPAFKRILNESDLCVPDGMPLVWLSRRAGRHWVGRVFGPDMMLALCRAMAEEGRSAVYYGGAPGVADDLAAGMEQRFPGLRTAGIYCPPFRPLENMEKEKIAQQINASGADMVWVGLSTPKQEKWMAEFRNKLEVPVLAGVGAAFDYNTGRINRAPKWMQNSGLEWLYRLIQEPRRLTRRYARNNPLFVWYLLTRKDRENVGWQHRRSK